MIINLKKSFLIVAKIDRDSLIKYKIKENKKELNVLRLNMTFDHNYSKSLKADTLYNFYLIKNYYTWLNKFKLAFSNAIMPNKNNAFLPVVEHFRLKRHILLNHFRFCIFNKNLEKSKRLSTKIDIINIFRQFTNTLSIKPDANKFNFNK